MDAGTRLILMIEGLQAVVAADSLRLSIALSAVGYAGIGG
jgi:hypothetical protein